MSSVRIRAVVLATLSMAVISLAQSAFAGRYFYEEYYQPPVAVQGAPAYYAPAPVAYVPVAGPRRPVVIQQVQAVAQPAPGVVVPAPAGVVQPGPVAVQGAPVYAGPRVAVNRGLFWKTKQVVTGPPGHETYQYHVHRFLAPNYHYTVTNDDGYVRAYGRRSW